MRPLPLALLLLLPACRGAEVPNLDSPGHTVVCFGDSLTAGVGRGDDPSYPELLAGALEAEVINEGVPGETSEQALRRLERVLAHDPWLVIVALGGNDLLKQVPPERTEAALEEIVQRVLNHGAVPVLIEVRGPFFGSARGRIFDRLEKRHRIPVVRGVVSEILADPGLKSDPIHPNGAGYRRLAAAVVHTVEPLLEQRRRLR